MSIIRLSRINELNKTPQKQNMHVCEAFIKRDNNAIIEA